MHAYLWDRYYGVCLAKYQHGDVVNSVAFNSRDSEMLVTASDDYTVKVLFLYNQLNSSIKYKLLILTFLNVGLAITRKSKIIECSRNQTRQ